MSRLTVVSLFDGIGGFPLAFERAGARTVAAVEIDPAAAAIGQRHFPHAHHFTDVTKVTGDELRAVGFVPRRGVLTAGWPCQDFSVAGRRAGLAGARSGLWWHVARLLAELRPTWFIGENVPGLLSSVCQCPGDRSCVANGHHDECDGEPHDVQPDGCCVGGCMRTHGGAMGSVLGSLAELGYGVAYRILDAQHFGVPQQRRRVFIVGHLGEPWSAPAQVLLEPESCDGDLAPCGPAGPDAAGRPERGVDASGRDIAPTLVARYAKGTDSDATDALIVQCVTGHRAHTLTSEGADASEDGTGRGTPIVIQAAPKIAATLTAGTSSPGVSAPGRRQEDDHNLVATETVVRRLTELECTRLQGYPDGWTDDQSGAAQYRQLGNSVAVPVVEWIARRLVMVDGDLP